MNPRDAVAIILSITVLAFVLSGTVLRQWVVDPNGAFPSTESVQAWKDIINVILGALAGYISGRARSNGG